MLPSASNTTESAMHEFVPYQPTSDYNPINSTDHKPHMSLEVHIGSIFTSFQHPVDGQAFSLVPPGHSHDSLLFNSHSPSHPPTGEPSSLGFSLQAEVSENNAVGMLVSPSVSSSADHADRQALTSDHLQRDGRSKFARTNPPSVLSNYAPLTPDPHMNHSNSQPTASQGDVCVPGAWTPNFLGRGVKVIPIDAAREHAAAIPPPPD